MRAENFAYKILVVFKKIRKQLREISAFSNAVFATLTVGIKCGYLPDANRFAIRLADMIYSSNLAEQTESNQLMLLDGVNTGCSETDLYTLDLDVRAGLVI